MLPNQYSFVNKAISKGIGFYRIASVAKDGKTAYNGIRKIAQITNKGRFALLSIPIVQGVLQVQFNNTAELKLPTPPARCFTNKR